MSTTATMTIAAPRPAESQTTTYKMSTTASIESALSSCACPSCGLSLTSYGPLIDTQTALAAAQAQIDDLQAQVRLLGQKASAAADRWADHEDELARLRAKATTTPPSPPPPPSSKSEIATTIISVSPAPDPAPPTPSPTRTSFLSTSTNRISALLAPRKSVPSFHSAPASPPQPPPPTPTEADLLKQLTREQNLRRAAEKTVSATSREVEELSVSLFEQANEMVASERRARARLEERVEVLERRDADKGRRLERLEGAVGRIERVRALLGQDVGGDGGTTGIREKGP